MFYTSGKTGCGHCSPAHLVNFNAPLYLSVRKRNLFIKVKALNRISRWYMAVCAGILPPDRYRALVMDSLGQHLPRKAVEQDRYALFSQQPQKRIMAPINNMHDIRRSDQLPGGILMPVFITSQRLHLIFPLYLRVNASIQADEQAGR